MINTTLKRGAVLTASLALLLGSLAACSASEQSTETLNVREIPPAFTDPNADGTALANAWFELLALTGSPVGEEGVSREQAEEGRAVVGPYLDPAFQLQRASGERYTAATYLPMDVDAFEVTNVIETSPEDNLRVIRYAVRTPGAVSPDTSMVFSDELTPRLTVMRWDETLTHWVIVSHANFNNPVAAICSSKPISVDDVQTTTNAEDQALGESLVAQWRDIATGKSKQPVRHPQVVIQLADGQGWPSEDAEINWSPAQDYDYDNLVVTRNGRVLIASYDAVVSELEMEGAEYRAISSPRLQTYLQNTDGAWQLIGLANFTVPEQIPTSLECE